MGDMGRLQRLFGGELPKVKTYIARALNESGKPIGNCTVCEVGDGPAKISYTIINGKTYFTSPAKWEERNEGA